MKRLRGAGLVVGCAAVWTATLWLSRYYLVVGPAAIFTTMAAVGLPAFFAGALAYRWRLWQPPVWPAAGYCLGSGLATAALIGPGEPAARYAEAALTHAASVTVLMPSVGGGFVPAWGNLIWLAGVVVIARYGIDAYRGDAPLGGGSGRRK